MKCRECDGRGFKKVHCTSHSNFGDEDDDFRFRYLCPKCHGRGSDDGPPKFEVKPCVSCGGTGSHEYTPLDEPTRFWTCCECDGVGRVAVCALCCGRGCYTDPTYGFWVDYCGQCSGGERVWVTRG